MSTDWACQECGHRNDNDFIRCEKCDCSPFKFDCQNQIEILQVENAQLKARVEELQEKLDALKHWHNEIYTFV